MASYAAISDLTNVMNTAALTTLSTGQQTQALSAASDIADSYFRAQYTLPLLSWGQDVIDAVCNIAAYRLMTLRGYGPEAGADSGFRKRYEDAIDWLKMVAKNETVPNLVDSASGGAEGGVFIVTGSMRGWSNRGNTANDPGNPYDGD